MQSFTSSPGCIRVLVSLRLTFTLMVHNIIYNLAHLINILTTLRVQMAKDRNVDEQVLTCLMPALARACSTYPAEVLKLMTMVYALSPRQALIFTPTLRIMLLFLDPVYPRDLLQMAQ